MNKYKYIKVANKTYPVEWFKKVHGAAIKLINGDYKTKEYANIYVGDDPVDGEIIDTWVILSNDEPSEISY